jgi:hypothetical protein
MCASPPRENSLRLTSWAYAAGDLSSSRWRRNSPQQPGKILNVQLLGYQDKLHWKQDNQGLKVRMPAATCLTSASPSKSRWPESERFNTNEVAASALLQRLLSSSSAPGAGVDNSMLLDPPADSWPQYHGTYDGQRHSKLEQITPQNVGPSGSCMGFSDRTRPCGNQIHSAAGRWRAVLYCARQRLGGRCALRSPAMALHLPAQSRFAYWQPRRGDVQGLAVFPGPGWAPGIAQRQRWQRALDCAR